MKINARLVCLLILGMSSAIFADKMYWVDRGNNTVQFADRDGTNRGSFAIGTSSTGVAVDALNGHVYWSENGPDKIRRANLDGSSAIDVHTGDDALGLALDVYGGKIYWSTDGGVGDSTVSRKNLDGTGTAETVVTISVSSVFPLGLALDLPAGKVYWAEFLTQKIKRANLDGTQVEEIIPSAGGNLTEITLDLVNGKIYWGTCLTVGIRRANLDGTSIETIIPNTGNTLCSNGVDVDPVEGKLYWTNESTASVYRANLNGSSPQTLVTTNTPSPEHIALDTLPQIPAGIPAASTWGLTSLAILLLIGGTMSLRRRPAMAGTKG